MDWKTLTKTIVNKLDKGCTTIENWCEAPIRNKILAEMAANTSTIVINDTNSTRVLEEVIAAQMGIEIPSKEFQVVSAIPVNHICSCGEHIPVEAIFCPYCRKQHITPNAKVSDTPPITACKIKGIGPKKEIQPTKKSFFNKLKELKCPTAKIRAKFHK
jgi:hypothetical protein